MLTGGRLETVISSRTRIGFGVRWVGREEVAISQTLRWQCLVRPRGLFEIDIRENVNNPAEIYFVSLGFNFITLFLFHSEK